MTARAKAAVLAALDRLGLALADKGHRWTNAERRAYEAAVRELL